MAQVISNRRTLNRLRDEWDGYLTHRMDYDLAVDLLTKSYKPLVPIFHPDSYSVEESARYEAELEFFADHSDAAEDLLDDIVCQRYSSAPTSAVNLRGLSGRQLISTARLFHEKLVILSDSYDDMDCQTCVGLPVARSDSQSRYFHGPVEKYRIGIPGGGKILVSCDHRTEPEWDMDMGLHAERLGGCYVYDVGTYREIVDELESILDALDGDQRRLADLFVEFAHSNKFSSQTPELTFAERRALARISFLILEIEQSEWQSACFFSGYWQMGMTVSFARLVRLFRDGIIDLDQLFFQYSLYSTKNMLGNHRKIEKTCQKIDALYQSEYGGNLTKKRAKQDLVFLYGKDEN